MADIGVVYDDFDEILLKQMQSFKPVCPLKNPLDMKSLADGAIIEVDDDELKNGVYAYDDAMEDDANDFDEDEEEDEQLVKNFEKINFHMQKVSEDGKVMKSIIRTGSGDVVPSDSLCKIHYSAFMLNEVEPFDSSRTRNKPHLIRIGANGDGLIGLQIAVSSMKRHEISKFLIHPDYAYGACGCPPRVAPGTHVIFEIELIGFVGSNQDMESNLQDANDDENPEYASFEEALEFSLSKQKEGNDYFHQKDYSKALTMYGKAIRTMENCSLADESQEARMNQFCVAMFLNVAICCLQTRKFKYCKNFAQKALAIESDNLKALYRLSKAERALGNFEKAKELLQRGLAISPSNSDFSKEIASLQKDIDLQSKSCSDFYTGIFGTKKEHTSANANPCLFSEQHEVYKTTKDRLMLFCNHSVAKEMKFPDSLTMTELQCVQQACYILGLEFIRLPDNKKFSCIVRKRNKEN